MLFWHKWCLQQLNVSPSVAPPKRRLHESLLSMCNYFSTRPVWGERLASFEEKKWFSRRAIAPRMSYIFKKAV